MLQHTRNAYWPCVFLTLYTTQSRCKTGVLELWWAAVVLVIRCCAAGFCVSLLLYTVSVQYNTIYVSLGSLALLGPRLLTKVNNHFQSTFSLSAPYIAALLYRCTHAHHSLSVDVHRYQQPMMVPS